MQGRPPAPRAEHRGHNGGAICPFISNYLLSTSLRRVLCQAQQEQGTAGLSKEEGDTWGPEERAFLADGTARTRL